MYRKLNLVILFSLALPLLGAENILQIYTSALQGDPALKAEQARSLAASEVKKQANGALLPSLAFSTDYANTHRDVIGSNSLNTFPRPTNFTSTQYRLTLTQPLFRKDLWTLRGQGSLREQIAKINLQFTEQKLILQVAELYFQVLAAMDNLEFARAEKTAVGRQLEQVRKRLEVGQIAITDLHESEARSDLAIAQQIEAENRLALGLEAMREVTGIFHEKLSPLGSQAPMTAPQPNNAQAWVDKALTHNLLIAGARLNLHLALRQVQLQRAGHLPNVNLSGIYTRDKNDGSFFITESTQTSIALNFSLSLYQGGQVAAKVREARQLYMAAKQNLEQQMRKTKRETRTAYLNIVAGVSRIKALNQALKSTETALKATRAGFDVGIRTSVDMLNAQREMFRARRDYSQARYDFILNKIRLQLAAGSLQRQNIKRINSWLSHSGKVRR